MKLHFALRNSHCTLRIPNFISQCTLKTPHFTLHTSDFTVHTSDFSLFFSLHTLNSTLHTSLCTLHSSCPRLHTALFTLHTPHCISSEFFSPLLSPHPFSYVTEAFMNHFPLPLRELTCAVRQPRPCVRALCEALAQMLSKKMTSHFTLHFHTSHLHFTLALRTRQIISSQIT